MTPVAFPQVNSKLVAPPDMHEAQVRTLGAYVGKVQGGSCDGASMIVTAWKPAPEELDRLLMGEPVFLTPKRYHK